ncbi:MAG: RnfABCDGE type electron transport complex subunit B [Lachnospiraceae bacterium]|nr:RnfABCDGE type electron transport complex subunit B [Lachnospiraceae bacterium]
MTEIIIGILIATLVVGLTGVIIAVLLSIAGEKFKVEVDEKEIAVREALPGNNCGGCGYPGCDGLATAIAQGEAPVSACPVGGEAVAEAIAAIMGTEVTAGTRMTAVVRCAGTCEKAVSQYEYVGPKSCSLAQNNPNGGAKACTYGCTGFGDCKAACPFDAIEIIDGIAVVDKEKCKACGKCVATCPKHLIELIPYESEHVVLCNSKDKGIDVKKACQAGCIGCGLCARNCPEGAIEVTDNLAHINYEKCTNCGACKSKCPVKIIT